MKTSVSNSASRWALVLILFAISAAPAGATIIQRVDADGSSPGGSAVDSDSTDSSQAPLRDTLAEVSGPGFRAFSSAGVFGNVGLQAEHSTSGTLSTHAFIASNGDENVNLSTRPQRAVANFIIDGGEIQFLGTGRIDYAISIRFITENPGGTAPDVIDWNTTGRVEGVDFNRPTLTTTGVDIGTSALGDSRFAIPLSFQSVDLGVVAPFGFIAMSYDVKFGLTAQGVEIASWSFSDPGNISGFGDFPTITFSDVVASAPEPASLALVLGGLALVRLARWSPKKYRAAGR